MKSLMILAVFAAASASADSSFHDARSGISFRYPSGYRLRAGSESHADLDAGFFGPIPMDFTAPGGERIAILEPPDNAYPNTDFDKAYLAISIHPHLTQDECMTFDSSRENAQSAAQKKISGIWFEGIEETDAAMNHQYSAHYYHAFRDGDCYEIADGLATGGMGIDEGIKPFPARNLRRKFDRILRSIAIDPPARILATNTPSIRTFNLIPIDRERNRYRIVWAVDDADRSGIWLTIQCECSVTAVPDSGALPSTFQKDALNAIPVHEGSFEAEFANVPGPDDELTLRLFAAGNPAVAKTLTLTVPPLPIRIDSPDPRDRTAAPHSANPYNPIKHS